MICGQAFQISTPRNVNSDTGSRAFTKITCEAHRLTPGEASRLSWGSRSAWHKIKAGKLAGEGVVTAAGTAGALACASDHQGEFNAGAGGAGMCVLRGRGDRRDEPASG